MILAAVLLASAVCAKASAPPELSASSAILIDGESGRVLFERNARQERGIASITKLMTALVALEHTASLDEQVLIRPEWTGIEGSSIYLKAGETVTLEALLYGLLLNSGNDAAAAVAAYCAGTAETFVAWMNGKAAQLEMKQTHFTNPSGLSEDGHYSTAYDMALLARACSGNEALSRIVSTKSITLGQRTFTNHNKLLWRYEGCTGMKTGYTQLSGRTLISRAERDGRTLIAVTLNAPDDWADHAALFDYGFAHFSSQLLCTEGKRICGIPVSGGLVPFVSATPAETLRYPVSEQEQVCVQVEQCGGAAAPVKCGTVLGKLRFYIDGELIAETDLLAQSDVHQNIVAPRTLWERVRDLLT